MDVNKAHHMRLVQIEPQRSNFTLTMSPNEFNHAETPGKNHKFKLRENDATLATQITSHLAGIKQQSICQVYQRFNHQYQTKRIISTQKSMVLHTNLICKCLKCKYQQEKPYEFHKHVTYLRHVEHCDSEEERRRWSRDWPN